LDTPKAIALLWELVKDDAISPEDTRATLLDFDSVLGLGLSESNESLTLLLRGEGQKLSISEVPNTVQKLFEERVQARTEKDFDRSDTLRKKIESLGYSIEDTDNGPELHAKK